MSGFAIQQLPVAADSAIGADELAGYLHQIIPADKLRQHTCTDLADGAELTLTTDTYTLVVRLSSREWLFVLLGDASLAEIWSQLQQLLPQSK